MRTMAVAFAVAWILPALAFASDAEFVEQAANDGMAAVALGNYAAKHAKYGDVQVLGERIADDHDAANKELDALARSAGFLVPQQMNTEHKTRVASLEKLGGLDFDRAYVSAMIGDHEQAIALFRQQAQVKGPVGEWAQTKIPILQTHLALAQRVALLLDEASAN